MTPRMMVGILLTVVGAFIVFRGFNYSHQHAIRVGEFHATVEEQRAIPLWLGGVAIVGGVFLVGTDLRRRRAA